MINAATVRKTREGYWSVCIWNGTKLVPVGLFTTREQADEAYVDAYLDIPNAELSRAQRLTTERILQQRSLTKVIQSS
jgi:hypothetical protein